MKINLKEVKKRFCPHCTVITNGDWDYGVMGYVKYTDNPIFLIKKTGKFGEFWGCPNFPKCNYSESVPMNRRYSIDYEDELRPY